MLIKIPFQSGAKSPVPMASCLGGLASGGRNLGNRRVISHMISGFAPKTSGKRWKTVVYIHEYSLSPVGVGLFLNPFVRVAWCSPPFTAPGLQESPCLLASHLKHQLLSFLFRDFLGILFRSDGAMEVTS